MSFHFGIGNSLVLNCLLNCNPQLWKIRENFSAEQSYSIECQAAEPAEAVTASPVSGCPLLPPHHSVSFGLTIPEKYFIFFLWISTGDCPHSTICAMSDKAQFPTLIRSVTQLTDLVCTLPFGDNKANYLSFMIGNIMQFFVLLQSLDLMEIRLLTWLWYNFC